MEQRYAFTGNYFVSFNGYEILSGSPSSNLRVDLYPMTMDAGEAAESLVINLEYSRNLSQPMYFAFELSDDFGTFGVARAIVDLNRSCERLRVYFKLVAGSNIAKSETFDSVINGTNYPRLRKIAEAYSIFDMLPSGFGYVCESEWGNPGPNAQLVIVISPAVTIARFTAGYIFLRNAIDFVVFAMLARFCSDYIRRLILRSGLLYVNSVNRDD
jgi:hypothetical protein